METIEFGDLVITPANNGIIVTTREGGAVQERWVFDDWGGFFAWIKVYVEGPRCG